jgi:outer membrane protein assembly factor BamD (BamD/ComL family)
MRNALAILILVLSVALTTGCASTPQASELDRARTALVTGDYRGAETAAQTYIARDPQGKRAAEAYYLKGRALEDQTATSSGEAAQNLRNARLAYINALKVGTDDQALEGLIRASLADVAYWQDDFATAAEQGRAAYAMLDRDDDKAWALYRTGVSQQRLGQFSDADKTLAMVQEYHAGSEPARRAASRVGVRAFNVQVATYSNPTLAANAVAALTRQGLRAATQQAGGNRTVVFVGPYQSWGQASGARMRLVSTFPDALIVP